jgi:hypothetical protein
MNDIYRVAMAGGTPMPVTADRYASEFFGVPRPMAQRLLFRRAVSQPLNGGGREAAIWISQSYGPVKLAQKRVTNPYTNG